MSHVKVGRWKRSGRRPPLGSAVIAGAVLAGMVVTGAVAASGDPLREGVRNGTTRAETEIVGRVAESTGPKGGYVTRQSNISTGENAGGAAIYGCRAPQESTETCLRAANLSSGLALSLATVGRVGARIEVGDPAGVPFTTNATGLVPNLNADKLDGLDAQQIIDQARSGAGGASAGAQGPPGPQGEPGATGPAGPQGPRGPSDVRVASTINAFPVTCNGADPVPCTVLLSLPLGAGNWLVQAKVSIDNVGGAATSLSNRCGLVAGGVLLDRVRHALAVDTAPGETEALALMAVVSGVADGTAVTLRCTEQAGETLQIADAKITALQVASVTP